MASAIDINGDSSVVTSNQKSTTYYTTTKKISLDPILGKPYKFGANTDPYVDTIKAGESWIDNFLIDANLVTIVPGLPSAADNLKKLYSKKEDGKEVEADAIADSLNGADNLTLWTFRPETAKYWDTVAQIVFQMAKLLEVEEFAASLLGMFSLKLISGEKMAEYSKSDYLIGLSPDIDVQGGEDANIANTPVTFYNNGSIDVTESFSNSIRDSAFANAINVKNDAVKEFSFLTNNFVDSTTDSSAKGMISWMMGAMNNSTVKMVTGQKDIIYPKIWDQSSFSRPLQLQMKFATPYGSPEAVFKDVLLPYAHWLPFLAGRHMGGASYISPYILKMYSRGASNVQMGIVESASVTRPQNARSINGLPTELEMSITITDLYQAMPIPYENNMSDYSSNIFFMQYMSSLTGYNFANESTLSASIKKSLEAKLNTIGTISPRIRSAGHSAINAMKIAVKKKINVR
jgi:hypothetical protein